MANFRSLYHLPEKWKLYENPRIENKLKKNIN